jgi:hypothetical protein
MNTHEHQKPVHIKRDNVCIRVTFYGRNGKKLAISNVAVLSDTEVTLQDNKNLVVCSVMCSTKSPFLSFGGSK